MKMRERERVEKGRGRGEGIGTTIKRARGGREERKERRDLKEWGRLGQ